MLIRRFYDEKMAQASYLVGCQVTGKALVVDPNRDVARYLAAAYEEGLKISHVAETHIHADFVSGARELARGTGATLHLSAEGGQTWQYDYAQEAGVQLVRDGDFFMVGRIRLDVWHTPGHSPEHVTFLVTDTVAANRPMGALTGDFLFAGDVGRPDVMSDTSVRGAQLLYQSLTRFAAAMPDYLQIWPGHGADSACGKALAAVPFATLGYEKLFNPGLSHKREADFVDWVLTGQPERPASFARMKRINKEGPAILGDFKLPARMAETRVGEWLGRGTLVDLRQAGDFAGGHLPGSLNLPLSRSFSTWAGWLLSDDEDLYLIADSTETVAQAVRDLAAVGFDRVAGYVTLDALVFYGRQITLGTMAQITVDQLAKADDVLVVDVRGQSEYAAGHVPEAIHLPLGHLPKRAGELPKDKRIVLTCAFGERSAIAASWLKARGYTKAESLRGGFNHWHALGHPVA